MYSSKTTRLVTRSGVTFIQFNILNDTGIIKHAFSTKLGGVSTGTFASMNLNFNRGDDEENVKENYRRMAEALGSSPEDMVLSCQTHTSNVRVIRDSDRGKGIVRSQDYSDVDGMITDIPGIMLVTSHADCVPLFFVDPVRKAVGLSHSGWKGTAAQIGAVTVRRMGSEFGSRPEDIIAAVGPSICRDCYEVGEDVAEEFRKTFTEKEMKSIFFPGRDGRYQLDLWEANRIILSDCGLLPEHIAVTDICTSCRDDLLWSHRKTHGIRGGMAAFLQLI